MAVIKILGFLLMFASIANAPLRMQEEMCCIGVNPVNEKETIHITIKGKIVSNYWKLLRNGRYYVATNMQCSTPNQGTEEWERARVPKGYKQNAVIHGKPLKVYESTDETEIKLYDSKIHKELPSLTIANVKQKVDVGKKKYKSVTKKLKDVFVTINGLEKDSTKPSLGSIINVSGKVQDVTPMYNQSQSVNIHLANNTGSPSKPIQYSVWHGRGVDQSSRAEKIDFHGTRYKGPFTYFSGNVVEQFTSAKGAVAYIVKENVESDDESLDGIKVSELPHQIQLSKPGTTLVSKKYTFEVLSTVKADKKIMYEIIPKKPKLTDNKDADTSSMHTPTKRRKVDHAIYVSTKKKVIGNTLIGNIQAIHKIVDGDSTFTYVLI
eukprot:269981_1